MTYAEHRALWERQDRKCYLCGKPLEYEEAHTDHCHDLNKVRGVTHFKCNSAIGGFDDSPELMRIAADNLERRQLELAA